MSVNKANVQKVRDHIAAHPDRFNMGVYVGVQGEDTRDIIDDLGPFTEYLDTQCGTVACIAGWAAHLSGQTHANTSEMLDNASRWLGLGPHSNDSVAEDLFMARHPATQERRDGLLCDIPHTAAIKVLDHLIETGKVDWSIVDV